MQIFQTYLTLYQSKGYSSIIPVGEKALKRSDNGYLVPKKEVEKK